MRHLVALIVLLGSTAASAEDWLTLPDGARLLGHEVGTDQFKPCTAPVRPIAPGTVRDAGRKKCDTPWFSFSVTRARTASVDGKHVTFDGEGPFGVAAVTFPAIGHVDPDVDVDEYVRVFSVLREGGAPVLVGIAPATGPVPRVDTFVARIEGADDDSVTVGGSRYLLPTGLAVPTPSLGEPVLLSSVRVGDEQLVVDIEQVLPDEVLLEPL